MFKNNELLQLQSIISSEQKFRKPFKRALAADLLVILTTDQQVVSEQQSQATVDSVATQRFPVAVFVIQTQEDKSIIVKEDSGEAIDEPDASNNSIQSKSLYESAVATQPVASFASRRKVSSRRRYQQKMNSVLNSNGENDKKPAKEKDASIVPLSVLYKTHFKRERVVSNGKKFYGGFIYKGSAIEEVFVIPVQARRRKTHVYVVSHTVEAVVHLRSLGVLTAAGCGIGSVHAVVRSNLLVEPSEVEEGEM
ncbi:photolyase/blue-light receptor [Dorcoceras hygrometricum]|uniref:Photolyase/blue-light receptor n=1 Tax=Dorcoceras hygrometricum TaxID=472368 RepID=A0A2Z7CMR9_9LAMI|nr:photolyase/blue-light receptor [Dorcoceras hygrometricum]